MAGWAGTSNVFEPTAYTVLSCTWPGWTSDEDIARVLKETGSATPLTPACGAPSGQGESAHEAV